MYSVLHWKITLTNFVLCLRLMFDTLQELSELNVDLQERDIDVYKVNIKTEKVQLKFLKTWKRSPVLFINRYYNTWNLQCFTQEPQQSAEKQLLSREYVEMSRHAQVLDEKKCHGESKKDILCGEE